MKLKMKETVRNMAEKVAVKSYGRSVPAWLYEPKMPEAVKKAADKKN